MKSCKFYEFYSKTKQADFNEASPSLMAMHSEHIKEGSCSVAKLD